MPIVVIMPNDVEKNEESIPLAGNSQATNPADKSQATTNPTDNSEASSNYKPKKQDHKKLKTTLLAKLKELLNKPDGGDNIIEFKQVLEGEEVAKLKQIYEKWKKKEENTDKIAVWRSFLKHSGLQEGLAVMLKDISKNPERLKVFIDHFDAFNEQIEPEYIPKPEKDKSKPEEAESRPEEAESKAKKPKSKPKKNKPKPIWIPMGALDTPLHCAVRQLNEGFIDWLLAKNKTEVNLRNRDKETALSLLCTRYDDCKQNNQELTEQVDNELSTIEQIMPKLLDKGADFNIYTNCGLCFDKLWKYYRQTDLKTIGFIENKIKPNTKAIARNDVVEKSNNKNINARSGVVFYNDDVSASTTVELLEILIRFDSIDEFKKRWEMFTFEPENVKKVITLLLHTAINCGRMPYVNQIIAKGHNEMFKHGSSKKMLYRVELKGVLKKMCLKGDADTLRLLLSHMSDRPLLNEAPVLIMTINQADGAKGREKTRFLSCAKVLIENHKKVNIRNTDNMGNTALHVALSCGFEKLALLMLKESHGLLEITNKQHLSPIDSGTMSFWESYLDSCISIEERMSLKFDIRCLRNLSDVDKSSDNNDQQSESVSCFSYRRRGCGIVWDGRNNCIGTEMTALRLISQSKERSTLLMHPTIISFITLKWKRLYHWNILNLLLTLLTMLFFAAYTLMLNSDQEHFSGTLGIVSAVGAFLMFFRELIQMILLGSLYLTLENIIDVVNLILMGYILVSGFVNDSVSSLARILSPILIISLAFQVSFLLSALSFNKISTIMYMFKTVSWNFFHSFVVFTPLISAFVYGFYLMNNTSPGYLIHNDCPQENFNQFSSFGNATIKTLTMATGEFEAANINLEGGKGLLFIVFVFIAPIVIMNLINGIAVSDITVIRKQSELISICKKVELLERYERAIVSSKNKLKAMYIGVLQKPFYPEPFFEEYDPLIYVNMGEMNRLELVRSQNRHDNAEGASTANVTTKKTRETIPFITWPKRRSNVLLLTLEQQLVSSAKVILAKRDTISSADHILSLPDTKQTTLKTANNVPLNKNQSSLDNPSEPVAGPSQRNAHMEQLQLKLSSVEKLLNDIKLEIQEMKK